MIDVVSTVETPETDDPACTEDCLVQSTQGVYNRYIKRLLDLALAIPLFIILIPTFLIVSFAIVVETGFPILYCAPRGGYKGHTFKMCKFRTMVKAADKMGGPTTGLNDPRVTHIGQFLRKTKLDETAQLINILCGQMSFVGPRPEVLQYVERFSGLEKYILEVRPGITDYSSLKFVNLDEIVGSQNVDEVFETVVLPQKNRLRVQYAAEISFRTDCKIFFETVWRVCKKAIRVIKSRKRIDNVKTYED